METLISAQNTFSFDTPDDEVFTMHLLDKYVTKSFISDQQLTRAPEEYKLVDGLKVLSDSEASRFLVCTMESSYYFSKKDFLRYKRGKNYWQTGLFPEGNRVYVSFNLHNDAIVELLKEAHPLPVYKPFDGYKACILSNNRVMFVRQRVATVYDAYWFPTLEDFNFSYSSFAY